MNLLESKYTIELRYLLNNGEHDIFNFNYDFYDEGRKLNFERKFINHYFFHEIGCESVARWKHMLKSKLDMIAPYYKQLYETECKSKGIEFLLNKDLKETFIRELTSDTDKNIESFYNVNSKTDSKANNKNDYSSLTESKNENITSSKNNNSFSNNIDFIESNINNGNASLSKDSLTNINNTNEKNTTKEENSSNAKDSNKTDIKDTTNNDYSGVTNNSTNGNNKNVSLENSIEKEATTLISQGNIGTTSSAELLQKWREVLINIDEMIIEECRNLFMLIY